MYAHRALEPSPTSPGRDVQWNVSIFLKTKIEWILIGCWKVFVLKAFFVGAVDRLVSFAGRVVWGMFCFLRGCCWCCVASGRCVRSVNFCVWCTDFVPCFLMYFLCCLVSLLCMFSCSFVGALVVVLCCVFFGVFGVCFWACSITHFGYICTSSLIGFVLVFCAIFLPAWAHYERLFDQLIMLIFACWLCVILWLFIDLFVAFLALHFGAYNDAFYCLFDVAFSTCLLLYLVHIWRCIVGSIFDCVVCVIRGTFLAPNDLVYSI